MSTKSGDIPTKGIVLGIDLGDARCGVAKSNPDQSVATPLVVLKRSQQTHREIKNLVTEWEAVTVVVGLPLSLDGTHGPMAKKVGREVDALRKSLGVPVLVHDERLTTVTAQQSLSDLGISAKDQRKSIDMVAAAVLLQSWLDSR